MSSNVCARDVPEIRARMAGWARDAGPDGAANWFTFVLGPQPEHVTESRVFNRADNVAALIAETMAAQLPVADLFFVSADMTDLARHAATTLTDYRLHPEDLPAPIGLMIYEHPPVEGTENETVTASRWCRGDRGAAGCGCTPGQRSPSPEPTGSRGWAGRWPTRRTKLFLFARGVPLTSAVSIFHRRPPPTRRPTGFSPGCSRTCNGHRSRRRSARRTATTGVD